VSPFLPQKVMTFLVIVVKLKVMTFLVMVLHTVTIHTLSPFPAGGLSAA